MIIMPTLQCRAGMKLGRSVYSERKQVLARKGFILSDGIIRRFHEMGFPFLHVEEAGTEDITPEQAIRDETLIVLNGAMSLVMQELSVPGKEAISFSAARFCHDAAELLAKDLRGRRGPMCLPVHLATAMGDGGRRHFVEHALNVAFCVTKVGLEAGLPNDELIALAMGGLLHDVGRLRLPGGLGCFGGAGEDAHAELGYQLLRDSGFPLLTAHCALFHHERLDGSGYPYGAAGSRIHDMVQWVGIIDTLDALLHGRWDGSPMLPSDALEVLYGGVGSLYDLEKIKLLRDRFALFPIGTVVRLSTGETGVVSRLHEDNMQRPRIRIVREADGSRVERPFEIDLRSRLDLMVCGLESGGRGQAGERLADSPHGPSAQPSPRRPAEDRGRLACGRGAAESRSTSSLSRPDFVAVSGGMNREYWNKEWLQFV